TLRKPRAANGATRRTLQSAFSGALALPFLPPPRHTRPPPREKKGRTYDVDHGCEQERSWERRPRGGQRAATERGPCREGPEETPERRRRGRPCARGGWGRRPAVRINECPWLGSHRSSVRCAKVWLEDRRRGASAMIQVFRYLRFAGWFAIVSDKVGRCDLSRRWKGRECLRIIIVMTT
ncbi:hypothetical protein LCGC14_1884720, partial [marine sediment metagenome]